MNMNFISTEALLNEDPAEASQPIPSADQPVNVPPSAMKAQKSVGNLTMPPPGKPGYITCVTNADGHREFHCLIFDVVFDCAPYYSLLNLLWQAESTDTIYLDIYTYGGEVETGCHIINAIQHCKGKVIGCAYGLCCSIGAMIWSACPERMVTSQATMMYHMPSGGCFGKTADNMEESACVQAWFLDFMKKITAGVLTDEEFEKVTKCRNDLFISAEELQRRLTKSDESSEHMNVVIPKKRRGVVYAPYEPDGKTTASMEDVQIIGADMSTSGSKPMCFSKQDTEDNKVNWTFYLTGPCITGYVAGDFMCKMLIPGVDDSVLIHAPSEIDLDTAEILISAVERCKAKNIVISAPYVMNSNAAYFATCGAKLVTGKYGVMNIGMPFICTHGKIVDADNAIAMHKHRIARVLKTLQKKGLIKDQEALVHIAEEQGMVSIYGEELDRLCNQSAE